MNAAVDRVREMALVMAAGEQRYDFLCPSCGGGSSRDKSFAVKRDVLSIAYICHRASCGFKGRLATTASIQHQPAPSRPNTYTGILTGVPAEIREKMAYRIEAADYDRRGILWAPTFGFGRLALPIMARDGTRTGYTFRAIEKRDKPKSVIRLSTEHYPVMSWYSCITGTSSVLILVEDQLSAYKASYFCDAAALIGTNLSNDKVLNITKAAHRRVIVALDEDATHKAAKLVARLSGIVDDVRILKLKEDLKDVTLTDIEQLCSPLL